MQRWGRKFTWPAVIVSPFLPIPSAIIFVIAGWAGMRLLTFIILDAIGTLLWAGMLAGLGYALGHHAVVVAQTISHYGLWISIGLIVVIVFFQVRSQRHMMRTASEARAAQQAGAAVPAEANVPAAEGDQAAAPEPDGLAHAHLAPLVSDGAVPSLAWAVVRDRDTAAGGFGGAGPETSFQIGSVTKVFTALVLADMAERGEVHLSDPAARYLPGRATDGPTLADLATHTSGLPRLPRGLLPSALLHPADPYARYPVGRPGARRPPGAARRALGRVGPAPLRLLQLRLRPARLPARPGRGDALRDPGDDADLRPARAARHDASHHPPRAWAAQGHRRGRPVRDWRLGAMAGAGGLYSTAADLARFLLRLPSRRPRRTREPAAPDTPPEALGPAIRVTLTSRRPIPGGQIGLAWHHARRGDRTIASHNGMTGGFSAMIALDPARRLGVAALANSAGPPPSPLDQAVLSAFGS